MSEELDLSLRIIAGVAALFMAVYLGWMLRARYELELAKARAMGQYDVITERAEGRR